MRNEVRFEDLIGKTVRNSYGRPIGRIEELTVDPVGEDYLVREFIIGPLGRLPRLLGFFSQLPTLRALGVGRRQRLRPFPWQWIDLTDPMRPVVNSNKRIEE
jgi:hypothetical protein